MNYKKIKTKYLLNGVVCLIVGFTFLVIAALAAKQGDFAAAVFVGIISGIIIQTAFLFFLIVNILGNIIIPKFSVDTSES